MKNVFIRIRKVKISQRAKNVLGQPSFLGLPYSKLCLIIIMTNIKNVHIKCHLRDTVYNTTYLPSQNMVHQTATSELDL